MTARRTALPRQKRACICRPRIFPAGGAALPAHVLQRRLAGSGIGPPAGVDPCVLLPLVSLGLRLRSRADRGRWDPVYCGTSSADCIRRRSVCRSAPEGRRGRCGISSSITAGMAGGTIFSGIFNQPYDMKTKETKAGILLTMILAAVVILFISQPFKGLIYSQMLLAIQLPITIFTQIYLTSSEKVMGKYVNSRRLNFLLLVIAVIVTGLNIALLFV